MSAFYIKIVTLSFLSNPQKPGNSLPILGYSIKTWKRDLKKKEREREKKNKEALQIPVSECQVRIRVKLY